MLQKSSPKVNSITFRVFRPIYYLYNMPLRYKYILIGLSLFWAFNAVGQTDSLISAYKAAASVEERANLCSQIVAQIPDSKPELYVAYAREGLMQVGTRDIAAKAKLANAIGYYHQQKGNYDSAIFYFSIGLATAKVIKAQKLINAIAGNIGEIYCNKGAYAVALKYQLETLNNYEQAQDTQNVQRLNISIGNTYYHMHEYKRALSCFRSVYPMLRNAKSNMAAGLFNSMALTYTDMGEYGNVLDLQKKALAIHRQRGDSQGVANSLNSMGKSSVALGDYRAALRYFNNALTIANALGEPNTIDVARQNIAYLEAKSGNSAAAVRQYKESLAAAKANGDLRLQNAALENLISVYDSLRDYPAANRYMAEYQQLSDTSRNITYARELADAETKYRTQRALRDRDRLSYESQQQAIARNRALHERNWAIGFSAGMIALLSIVFALAWRIRAIRTKAEEEKGFTRAIFEGEQNERIRIARDLHDSIGQMLSVVVMRLSILPDLSQTDLKESAGIATQLVNKTLDEVRTISHNLIPEDLHFGIVRGLENLCQKISAAGEVSVRLIISDEVRARKFDVPFSLSLYRIVQEVLGNMIRHSGASEINVSMSESATMIILQIADNGKGFDTDSISESKGIGWKNIFARVNLLNGSVDVQSARISGTRIEITLPQ
jgi:two-component system NarL family sensor kinase